MNALTAASDQPTTEIMTGTAGERCATCQSPLATDQRYCINCGARRGKPRFSAANVTSAGGMVAAPAPPQAPNRSRGGGATTLIAGVATLLVAMGVGVLIGHNSAGSQTRAPAAQVITVGGSGATAGGAATTASLAPSRAAKHGKAGKAKPVVVHITAKANKAAAAAVSKVLGSSSNLSSNPTQQQGAKCTGGAGCQNGTFSGNFFGQ